MTRANPQNHINSSTSSALHLCMGKGLPAGTAATVLQFLAVPRLNGVSLQACPAVQP
jgi:hypothetical protein